MAVHSGSAYNVLDTSSLAFSGTTGSLDAFTGNPVDSNQALLKVTSLSDLNSEGTVDGSDYGYMDYCFQSTLALSDLNGSGIVDGSLYGLLDYGFQTQVYGVLHGGAVSASSMSSAGTEATPGAPGAVPEPGTLGFGLMGAAALLGIGRKGRRHVHGA